MLTLLRSAKLLRELTETVLGLKRDFKQLELEWTETYDKFRLLHMKIAKRVQREEQLREEAAQGEGDSDRPSFQLPVDQNSHPGMLTPNQRKIQQQILRRRGGG